MKEGGRNPSRDTLDHFLCGNCRLSVGWFGPEINYPGLPPPSFLQGQEENCNGTEGRSVWPSRFIPIRTKLKCAIATRNFNKLSLTGISLTSEKYAAFLLSKGILLPSVGPHQRIVILVLLAVGKKTKRNLGTINRSRTYAEAVSEIFFLSILT